jgi:hypothetical protein
MFLIKGNVIEGKSTATVFSGILGTLFDYSSTKKLFLPINEILEPVIVYEKGVVVTKFQAKV